MWTRRAITCSCDFDDSGGRGEKALQGWKVSKFQRMAEKHRTLDIEWENGCNVKSLQGYKGAGLIDQLKFGEHGEGPEEVFDAGGLGGLADDFAGEF